MDKNSKWEIKISDHRSAHNWWQVLDESRHSPSNGGPRRLDEGHACHASKWPHSWWNHICKILVSFLKTNVRLQKHFSLGCLDTGKLLELITMLSHMVCFYSFLKEFYSNTMSLQGWKILLLSGFIVIDCAQLFHYDQSDFGPTVIARMTGTDPHAPNAYHLLQPTMNCKGKRGVVCIQWQGTLTIFLGSEILHNSYINEQRHDPLIRLYTSQSHPSAPLPLSHPFLAASRLILIWALSHRAFPPASPSLTWITLLSGILFCFHGKKIDWLDLIYWICGLEDLWTCGCFMASFLWVSITCHILYS